VKKITSPIFKGILPVLLFFNIANAQKLPLVQKAGLRAPANIKVDGKTTEWNNQLQAYNKAIQAYYTLSNDDNKLYLTLQAVKPEIINKIINGGVSLTIKKGGKKTTNGGMSVTYPVFNMDDRPNINVNDMALINQSSKDAGRLTDSLMNLNNSRLSGKAKFIRVNGINDLDTLVSIYNMNGVKVASAFNNKMAYTLEISIDLKLLGLSVNDSEKFNYNIRFNEMQIDFVPGIIITRKNDGTIDMMNVVDPKLANSFISALSTTDCWGEYTLVK
jgi:hypothetical protein